ncbi:polyprotein [Panicum miliaceum]|uniref:Polyprotein n=1 Tax=Panicum miliaceum TaxID=4540 RepID=A0A3L6PPD3_PANMI|nr:polyprotein [Panicum miliaceum]
MNQYRQLQEDELRCQLLQQQIQEKRRLLELCHPEDEDPIRIESPPRRQPQGRVRSEVVRPRERTIRIEDDLDEGPKDEYYRDRRERHRRSRRRLKTEELTSCDFHNCKQGKKETLQEYMKRIIKLQAKAPNVADLTVIEAATSGLRVRSCQDYLDRCKPNTVGELFDVMREYCKSDRGRRRRIEALNQVKEARTNQWSQPKP